MDRNSGLDWSAICTVVGALIAMAIGDALGLSHIIGTVIGDVLGVPGWTLVSIGRLGLAGLGGPLGVLIGECIKCWRWPGDRGGSGSRSAPLLHECVAS